MNAQDDLSYLECDLPASLNNALVQYKNGLKKN